MKIVYSQAIYKAADKIEENGLAKNQSRDGKKVDINTAIYEVAQGHFTTVNGISSFIRGILGGSLTSWNDAREVTKRDAVAFLRICGDIAKYLEDNGRQYRYTLG